MIALGLYKIVLGFFPRWTKVLGEKFSGAKVLSPYYKVYARTTCILYGDLAK